VVQYSLATQQHVDMLGADFVSVNVGHPGTTAAYDGHGLAADTKKGHTINRSSCNIRALA
jgi:hypothetical protein